MRRLLLILVTVVVIAAACGGSDGNGETTSAEPGQLPDFGGTTIDGQQLTSADYAGQDVVLWFWAPW